MTPFWFTLIYAWTQNRKRSGLTVPFIVGSEEKVKEKSSLEIVKSLVLNVEEYYNPNFVVTFFRCHDIGAYVFGLFPRNNANYYNGHWISENHRILIGQGVCANCNVDGLIDMVNNAYGYEIQNDLFSLNQNIWGEFNEFDKRFILEARELHGLEY
jgi:hypothetical protein